MLHECKTVTYNAHSYPVKKNKSLQDLVVITFGTTSIRTYVFSTCAILARMLAS